MKENEPQQKERPGKCANLNATTLLLLYSKNYVQLVTYAIIHEYSNNLSLRSSYFQFHVLKV